MPFILFFRKIAFLHTSGAVSTITQLTHLFKQIYSWSHNNQQRIISEVNIYTLILAILTARYTNYCLCRLQPTRDDCGVRIYTYIGSLAYCGHSIQMTIEYGLLTIHRYQDSRLSATLLLGRSLSLFRKVMYWKFGNFREGFIFAPIIA